MPISTRKTLQRIDLAELETFIAVAELGSFRAAAAQLNLSQPSVSGRVQRLETALHTKLLIRTTRYVAPTADGVLLLEGANRALDALGGLVDSFLQRAGQSRQRLSVAATPLIAALYMPALIRDYCARYTDVEVHLLDLRYPEILSALDSGEADMAVVSFDRADDRFTATPIASDEVLLVVPETHPLFGTGHARIDKLVGENLMLIDQYQPMFEMIQSAMNARNLAPPRTTTVSDVSTLTGMLDAGFGIALLSHNVAKRRRAPEGTLVHLDDVSLRRNYALVVSRKAERGTAALSFGDYLCRTLADRWPLRPGE
ncbi:LysR family transcriptional regulator YbhD [Candidatus Burkholderia verschuerenii]|uniref:LysR family transcriptional regulator YbhD n=1 Tax=Candidatus Burkholderia verschuerenii TaxID=242163 RepID=A0A0L0MFM6_9BURK|nr:LysR family transcriptional regulator [Candidatus Burkholderia verschuerenii]KND61123.1 LysR family transcriptional regulator YbhD [Candidatus Burkholderia verschuerenii]